MIFQQLFFIQRDPNLRVQLEELRVRLDLVVVVVNPLDEEILPAREIPLQFDPRERRPESCERIQGPPRHLAWIEVIEQLFAP